MFGKNSTTNSKDQLAINTLRINGVAAVNAANSGHPGIVLGAAPMLHTLFTRHLVYDPHHPDWVNRDRFILSAGHGSALLYSMLRILKLISTADLKAFRRIDSLTPGHPEYRHTVGVEATTGPLGQGLAMAVGIALGESHLHAKFPEINHHTYALCGDGDLQEGVGMEALSFAGKHQLKKLIVLHDSNDVQLDTMVAKVFNDNMKMRMEAIGFFYQLVASNDVESIDAALIAAKAANKPAFIEIKTVIGEGATKQNSPAVHGAPLGKDIEVVKKYYDWKYDDFEIPKDVEHLYEKTIFATGAKAYAHFKVSPALAAWLKPLQPLDLKLQDLKNDDSTRNISGAVVSYLNTTALQWIGGSADLSGSTKVSGGDGDYSATNPLGRNILFGVREFAMASIANGLALHSNFRPFVSTFLVFSDYLKPAIRLAALMNLPVTFIFTHDSIMVGEDGPTHQPIEHIAMLRSIPNIDFLRPADQTEVQTSYEIAFNTPHPSVIVLTRQATKTLRETSQAKMKQGAYYLNSVASPWTLVATGSELANALEIGKELGLNVISMSFFAGKPTWDVSKAISIEAASTFGWSKYAKYNIGIDKFGLSGEGEAVYARFGFDKASLKAKIHNIISAAK